MKQAIKTWLTKLKKYSVSIKKIIECITYFLYALATTNPFVDIQIQWVLTLVINLP